MDVRVGLIKKAEHRRIDAFELWCWRRLLRVPWTARRSNQSILKEISPEYSQKGLMLKLKLWYFGHVMQRTDSLGKTLCWERLKMGEEGDNRGWDGWMASLTQWTWVWVSSGDWWWTGKSGVLQSMGILKESDTTEPPNWTNVHMCYHIDRKIKFFWVYRFVWVECLRVQNIQNWVCILPPNSAFKCSLPLLSWWQTWYPVCLE